jgi:lysophospholipase L1-like esterase
MRCANLSSHEALLNHGFLTRLSALLLIFILTACSPPDNPDTSTAAIDAPAEDSLAADTVEEAQLYTGRYPSPRLKDYDWMSMDQWHQQHQEDIAIAAEGKVDLLFLGDSITAGWDQALWDKHFAPYNAANFGIGGDHTGNVLWRLQNGAIGALQPKAVVLLIGVNNFGHLDESPEEVFAGVTQVVRTLQGSFPTAKILLNGVFPYGAAAATSEREQVAELNKLLSTLADGDQVAEGDQVIFQDYGELFLQEDGTIAPDIMGDYLHLTPEGYRIWAEAMLPTLHAWLVRSEE